MHDCDKIREQLVDLIFDELEPETRQRLFKELEDCHDCSAQYRSMTEALRVFDQTVETAMPDESYWPGYESRLRARLQLVRPIWRQYLADWVNGIGILAPRPLTLAVTFALILLAIGWWWSWQGKKIVTPPEVHIVKESPTPSPLPESPRQTPDIVRKRRDIPNNRKPVNVNLAKSNRVPRSVPPEERREEMVAVDTGLAEFNQPVITASLFDPETIKHFEKAQLLLRSFRNAAIAKASGDNPAIDLSYEKQLSTRLLGQNILLRRDAEQRGNLPAEEALGSLEPILLDIANLPDKPSSDDLSSIRERLQRKEMIAALQIYSTQPSFPIYQDR